MTSSTLTSVPGSAWARALCGTWTASPAPQSASNIPKLIIREIHVWARVVTALTFS